MQNEKLFNAKTSGIYSNHFKNALINNFCIIFTIESRVRVRPSLLHEH
jgi:hypothetical protein